jgi:hypothetical protein
VAASSRRLGAPTGDPIFHRRSGKRRRRCGRSRTIVPAPASQAATRAAAPQEIVPARRADLCSDKKGARPEATAIPNMTTTITIPATSFSIAQICACRFKIRGNLRRAWRAADAARIETKRRKRSYSSVSSLHFSNVNESNGRQFEPLSASRRRSQNRSQRCRLRNSSPQRSSKQLDPVPRSTDKSAYQ